MDGRARAQARADDVCRPAAGRGDGTVRVFRRVAKPQSSVARLWLVKLIYIVKLLIVYLFVFIAKLGTERPAAIRLCHSSCRHDKVFMKFILFCVIYIFFYLILFYSDFRFLPLAMKCQSSFFSGPFQSDILYTLYQISKTRDFLS